MEEILIGKKVTIYYDRHIISSMESPSSRYDTINGTIEEIYDNMILISHIVSKEVRVRARGFFSDNYSYETRNKKVQSLINFNYIIRIDIDA